MPSRPRVSIVTPCYNGLPYVRTAISSVERIAAEVAVEHVVADGGSTDGTADVLSDAGWVTGISGPDDGLYSALNWAIEHARGEYIQWLNADDELPPGFVPRALELLDNEPELDIVLGETLFVDQNGKPKERWTYDLESAFDLSKQARGYFFNLNSSLIRASTLRKLGQFDQKAFPIGADLDIELAMVVAKARAALLPLTAYRFRIHGSSLTTGDGSNLQAIIDAVNLCRKWAQSPEVPETVRRKFALRTKQLTLGLGLKRLRSRATMSRGVADLIGFFFTSPTRTLPALFQWGKDQIAQGPPMRERSIIR